MKRIILSVVFINLILSAALAQTKKPVKKVPAKKPVPVHTTYMDPKDKPRLGQRVEIETDLGNMVVLLYDETPLHRDNFIKLVKEGFYDSLLFHRVIKTFMIQGGDPLSKRADSMAMLGSGDVGYKIPAEINPDLYHKRGALAAARDNNPQMMSSGCQFYIVQGRTYTSQEMEGVINNKNMSRKQEILYQIYNSDTVRAALNAMQNGNDKEVVRKYMASLQSVVDDVYKKKYPNADKVNYDQVRTYMEFGGAPHLDGAYTVFGELESGWDVLDKIAQTPTRPGDRPIRDIRMKMRLMK